LIDRPGRALAAGIPRARPRRQRPAVIAAARIPLALPRESPGVRELR
jgi:hypothetical protein